MTATPPDADCTASVVLEIVLDDYPAHFHVEEIIREVAGDPTAFGERNDVSNAIRDLTKIGLIHRHGDFVFATRAAVRSAELRI
jgi:hypothetical protein